ncbi:hypothetical protein AVEN_74442-1 [Araneus ventricosus]|uniref:Uncharacterized protein n=1 Tax=Araneus ventricosus TaxID=182803 RepID=A0A4Y2RKG1_ARAVE|nr:hypothetical protein AVEN_74442-1 [Araneus ventricosus]
MQSKQRGKYNLERLRECAACHGYSRRPGKDYSRRKLSLHSAFIRDCLRVLVPYYGSRSSAICSVPHTSEIRVPHQPSSLDDIRSHSEHGDTIPHQDKSNSDFSSDEGPQPFSQSYINDLVSVLVLKAVLLHSGNSIASLPLGHSLQLEENYNDLPLLLEKINYQEYRWMVYGDFKMLTMLLGQQAGYTKYPCLLGLWHSRARHLHWTKTDWSLRGALIPGEINVINTTLVPPEKVLLQPLHIKLGLMKQFIKSLPKDGECFRYLCSKFSKLSEAKLKEGVFTGPDI